MKILQENRQGYLRSNLSGNQQYYSFVPTPLQDLIPQLTYSDELIALLGTTSSNLGELRGMLQFVPNAELYLAMYIRKEALLSAQIEGTQCTFDDILDPDQKDLMQQDVAEVISYIRATEYAQELSSSLPLCLRFFKQVHAQLLRNARGEHKLPGEVRSSQNWIGSGNSTIATAAYIPPNVEDMKEALNDLDKFINEEDSVHPLIKAALIHYQFETIHPFLDGNGRLGRLLITLSLINDKFLTTPSFYPSYQLKLNRTEYYQRLSDVRNMGKYEEWLLFFCNSINQSALDSLNSLRELVLLKQKTDERIKHNFLGNLANAQSLHDLILQHPIFDTTMVSNFLGVSRVTASKLIKSFEELGIIQQRDEDAQRYRIYIYDAYLNILRQGAEPLSN